MNLEVLYEKMVVIRQLEERLQAYCDRGEAGDLHFNKGQEAIAVGVCAAMDRTDHMVTHHRTIAHQVAKGADLRKLVAELLGKSTGTNGGRAGEMHISDADIRHDFSFQIVGTCITVACGLAWALKNHKKNDEIVVCFFGDAATSNGQFHEGLNLAALHKLPILFICENNGRAGNITPEHYMVESPWGMASSRGIESVYSDGNDVSNVFVKTNEAMSYMGSHGLPYFLELRTERLSWHKQGQRDVRSLDELALLAKGEPILKAASLLGADRTMKIDLDVARFLDDVFRQVEADPLPEFVLDT